MRPDNGRPVILKEGLEEKTMNKDVKVKVKSRSWGINWVGGVTVRV